MAKALISIVVPVYNTAKYLHHCLDSIVRQTYEHIEVICINDGSTDESLQILEEFASKDKRIVVIDQLNQGLSETRNKGILRATGSYLMFVDSDDWIELDMCEQMLQIAEKRNVDIVLSSYNRCFGEVIKPKLVLPEERYYVDMEIQELRRRLWGLCGEELRDPSQGDSMGSSSMKLYRREIIIGQQLRFVDTREVGSAEDVLFNAEYFRFVRSAYYIHKCFYQYRKVNNQSLTSSYRPNLFKQWGNLFSRFESMIREENLPFDFKIALNNRICLGLIGLGLNELNSGHNYTNIRRKIDNIVNAPLYVEACKTLDFRYFPIHWKLFFYCAKKGYSRSILLMLYAIRYMIYKK